MSTEAVVSDERPADRSSGEPDWRHDPRETADSRQRRARRRRRSRIGAVVLAAVLVVGGGFYLGFVTGRVSLPGLGTLTSHPAGVATFQVDRTTYLMQFESRHPDTVTVFRQTGDQSGDIVAELDKPPVDGISVASGPTEATYFAVLPMGARDIGAVHQDSRARATIVSGVIPMPGGSSLVGVVVAMDRTQPAGQAAIDLSLSALRWVDVDGQAHTSGAGR